MPSPFQHNLGRLPVALRERGGQRLGGMAFALAVECALILLVLSLGLTQHRTVPMAGRHVTAISVRAAEDEAKQPSRQNRAKPTLAADDSRTQPRQPQPRPPVEQSHVARALPTPPAIIPISRDQMAALDISRVPRQPVPAAPAKALMGPVDTGSPGDSKRVGSAPNGQPLYAAAWYREPSDGELAGYLSTAQGPGYALIACRTAPDWRVEDCVGLDEYPSGSQIQRAVLAAAWQFKVRPPRLGGVYKVGEWVRIRIDYEFRPRRGG